MEIKELTKYIEFYLGETIEDLTKWDCEHLAMGLLDNLEIRKIKKNKKK